MPNKKDQSPDDLFIPKQFKKEYSRSALYGFVKEAREDFIDNNFDDPEECDIPEVKPINHYPDEFFQEAADIDYATMDRVWNDESDDSRDESMIEYQGDMVKLIKKYN